MTHGIHHITALCNDAQRTHDFYTKVLGLRMIKKTVNFDAPDVYHLYFGNETWEPSTVITFFPFEDAGTGMRWLGQVTKIQFAISSASIWYWLDRFIINNIKHDPIKQRFDEKYITFFDPDGLQLEIVWDDNTDTKPWTWWSVDEQNAIKWFYGAEISVESQESIHDILTILWYEKINQIDLTIRYENKQAIQARYLDILIMRWWPRAVSGAGTNHHIAFRTKDESEENLLREKIMSIWIEPTDIVERNYFKSVYFRENNQILFELATDWPWFLIDEDINALWQYLQLPSRYESQRSYIESILPPIYDENIENINDTNILSDLGLFEHKYVDRKSSTTYILFHGTGWDEREMVKFAEEIGIQDNILSIRWNILENNIYNRYFHRNLDWSFDQVSLANEIDKFMRFIKSAASYYGFEDNLIDMMWYSNGANFALAIAFTTPIDINKIIALHPVAPVDDTNNILQNTKIHITTGIDDEYNSPDKLKKLEDLLVKSKADYSIDIFESGHEISRNEIDKIKWFI